MSSMNYGLLNFKAQNGKPQIFWSNERTKKSDRKFGYKTKNQRYNIRQYPEDMGKEPVNFLQPDPPPEEKPKKPAKNFIKRNREHIAKKNKNKENDQTVTLTQEQLNAILASVGKVASGKEDALRISIDKDSHEIHVESPGRDGDGDRKSRRHHRKKQDEEPSIFSLVDDGNKKSRNSEDKRRHDRTPERSDSSDRYRSRKHSGDRDHHRKHSSDRDHRRKHSGDRDYRDHSNDRHRDVSYDRHRKHSGDGYREDSRERGRRHSRSRERYRTPSRERRRHSSDERRRHSREDRSRERRRYSPDDRSRERRRRSRSPEDKYRKDSPSEDRYRKRTPERKDEKPKVEENPPSPREIAGIPLSLPWKHMTKAERRRLMIAREKVLAEENRKEEEEKKKSFQELEAKLHKNYKRDDYRRDDYHHRRDDDRISGSDRGSSLKTTALPTPASNGTLSLGELKRRQWERERADSTTAGEFQPWGRPGAGAPIRTKSGNVAADYGKRKDIYPFINPRN